MELEESAALVVFAKAAKMKFEGVDVIGFGVGEPDFATPANVLAAGIEALKAGQTKYSTPTSGLAVAKKAVCAKFKRDNELEYKTDQIIVTPGGKMAVYMAVHALVNPGDEVVIPVPYWVCYPEIVKLAGGVPVFVIGSEANDYKLTASELRAALTNRTRLIILNSPSNPSGATYSPDETSALAEAVRGRDVIVLSDEIYDQMLYFGQRALSFAAASPDAYSKTITVNAASKAYAMTGWRVGYAAGPRDVIDAMGKLQSLTTSGAATFTQAALAAALDGDQSSVETMRAEFERRSQLMWEGLQSIPGVRCAKPTGAFFCFPNVSMLFHRAPVHDSQSFTLWLLEKARVAVVPGYPFGLDQHVRLSFATSIEKIEEGLNRIRGALT
jgi:aspartate aminotransferase